MFPFDDVTMHISSNRTGNGNPVSSPGARPINGILIDFEIRPKFTVLWFKMYPTDHNEILLTSR